MLVKKGAPSESGISPLWLLSGSQEIAYCGVIAESEQKWALESIIASSPRSMDEQTPWRRLDDRIKAWWDDDLVIGKEALAATPDAFELPAPYIAGGARTSPAWYATMFSWDTHFINMALLVHGRGELIRGHIENYLAMIDRFGYMPNGNQLGLSTRSQIPVIVDSFWRYLQISKDEELLSRVYPALCKEYTGYWLADHHSTPTGLATNRDLGDPHFDPRLAAEAETGLDFTTQYGGDVTKTNPVITNSCLVVYARVLGEMATCLGDKASATRWNADADRRSALVRLYCWDEKRGLFMDYNYVDGCFVQISGATAYWALWAGIATVENAQRSVEALPALLFEHGLATTLPSQPEGKEFVLAFEDLQWTHPAGWPPLSIIATLALDRYGHHAEARDIARRTVNTILDNYNRFGELYEKYNVVDGSIVLPNARYGTIPLHGWTSAAVVLLGRRAELDVLIDDQLAAADLKSPI